MILFFSGSGAGLKGLGLLPLGILVAGPTSFLCVVDTLPLTGVTGVGFTSRSFFTMGL
jgi:hypothetical protein